MTSDGAEGNRHEQGGLMSWKPIDKDTPRDGTPVLLHDGKGNYGLGILGRWDDVLESFGRGSACWTGGFSGMRLGYLDPEEAAGWMPLPELPASVDGSPQGGDDLSAPSRSDDSAVPAEEQADAQGQPS
jgi:hypothetical protein